MKTLASLLVLQKPDRRPAVPGDWPIFALALVSLAAWIGLDWFASEPGSQLYLAAAPYLCWFLVGALVLAWALARRSFPHVPYRSALLLIAGLAPVAIVAGWLIAAYVPPRWHLFGNVLLAAYCVAVIARALVWMTGRRQFPALIAAAVIALVFAWTTGALGLDGAVWYAPDSDSEEAPAAAADIAREQAAAIDTESLLFAQQRRIDAALRHVRPSANDADGGAGAGATPGQDASRPAQTFFLGFAGVGEQHVFAEEIKLAATVAAVRYGSVERTLLLVNDRRDRESLPIATITNLRYALGGIAARMDTARDVLFLALSSHGSADPALAVTNERVPLAALTGEDLAAALQESGIRWKVIVISACHAGAFIPLLQDDHTVVITASAADRTSFGCSDDRDLTYFGEAFYRDALPKAHSLREAFAATTRAIAERERAEGFDPSHPQAFFGSDMDRKLAEIEKGTR